MLRDKIFFVSSLLLVVLIFAFAIVSLFVSTASAEVVDVGGTDVTIDGKSFDLPFLNGFVLYNVSSQYAFIDNNYHGFYNFSIVASDLPDTDNLVLKNGVMTLFTTPIEYTSSSSSNSWFHSWHFSQFQVSSYELAAFGSGIGAFSVPVNLYINGDYTFLLDDDSQFLTSFNPELLSVLYSASWLSGPTGFVQVLTFSFIDTYHNIIFSSLKLNLIYNITATYASYPSLGTVNSSGASNLGSVSFYNWNCTALSASESSFNQGFNAGYSSGFTSANNTVTETSASYSAGYYAGSNAAGNYTFFSLLSAVVDVPVKTFVSLFNFEILGFNMLSFVSSLLAVCTVLAVVHRFL